MEGRPSKSKGTGIKEVRGMLENRTNPKVKKVQERQSVFSVSGTMVNMRAHMNILYIITPASVMCGELRVT